MVNYNLSHLTQDASQHVAGPIQDDEALFLYSIIKGMRLTRILEIGGLSGYSAKNFLQAMDNVDGILYTVDINHVPTLASNHKVIIKNAIHLTKEDVDDKPIDLIFFDCHDMIQMDIYRYFLENNIINDKTIIALHDTNLHYPPHHVIGRYLEKEGGYVHQPVERQMVNMFKELGYNVFNLHTTKDKHSDAFPYRHGVSICQKSEFLNV